MGRARIIIFTVFCVKSGFQARIELLDGRVKATLRSLSAKDQIEIEGSLGSLKGSTAFVLHTYSLKLLSHTVVTYGKETFKDSVEALKFLETLPGAVIDYLVKQQTALEKEIAKLYTGKDIDEVFFETASTERASQQSQKDSTSEPEGVSEK